MAAMAKKPEPRDAGRLVRKAAEVLNDKKWGRGCLWDPVERSMCLAGAINYTYCGYAGLRRDRVEKIPLLNLTYNLLDHFLPVEIEQLNAFEMLALNGNNKFGATEYWNDQKDRTKEEVLQWMNKFADEYDPKQV